MPYARKSVCMFGCLCDALEVELLCSRCLVVLCAEMIFYAFCMNDAPCFQLCDALGVQLSRTRLN